MFHLWCHVSAPKVSNIGVFCISDFQIKNAQLTGGITALKVISGLALCCSVVSSSLMLIRGRFEMTLGSIPLGRFGTYLGDHINRMAKSKDLEIRLYGFKSQL
jgi:hypothetical protein